LILRERPLIGLTGIVVRSWEERPRVYGHAVEFVDLSMREQDDIVRFVFSEQVRRRTNDLF
jgi:c-di-GMP-binding flagellar brake protein YcgR